MRSYEVVIIGAGSAGEAVARGLREAGKTVAVVEKLRIGGECAYLSCMPSKAMLRSAKARKESSELVELGASPIAIDLGNESIAFAWAAKRRDRIVEQRDDTAAANSLSKIGVDIYRGLAKIIGLNQVQVGDEILDFTELVISSGSTSTIPKIEGIEEVGYWTSDEALSVPQAPRSVAIIGGGPVACELAQIFSRFGTVVTVIEFSGQLAGKEHPLIAERLAENLRLEGVKVLLDTEVQKVNTTANGKAELFLSKGEPLEVEQVIIATGRHPIVVGLGLEILGIKLTEKGAIPIGADCRVEGQLHVWSAGDVTGIAPFTHTANYQARIVVANILGGTLEANYSAIPRAIYTDPPVASVGDMSKSELQKNIALASVEISTLSRFSTDGGPGGVLILAADLVRGVLVGACAIGPHADEWLAEATLAVRAEIPLSLLVDVVHAFPTYGEAFEAPFRELASLSKSTKSAA